MVKKGKKILWLTWKDLDNPLAGGAEVVNEELAKRLVKAGYQVTFLVGGFPGGQPETSRHGFVIKRVGGRWSVYWQAYRRYKQEFEGWPDVVIDEINTVPFFARFYAKEKTFLFIHQLCREIWFYQMFFPLNWLGYWLEPLYLRLLRRCPVITVSESTRQDLGRYGFPLPNIHVISEGIELEPVKNLARIKKYPHPTLLSLGALREMKRTDQIILAFEAAKTRLPDLQLIVAGSAAGKYGQSILRLIGQSPYRHSINYLGKVSREKKIELMQKCHLLLVTSVKEGWGLVVTEANSQGTPAIAYNGDGLRDSIRQGETGVICQTNTPENLADNVLEVLSHPARYAALRQAGWEWSRQITFEQSFQDFISVIEQN